MDDILQLIQHGIDELNQKSDIQGTAITKLQMLYEALKNDIENLKCLPRQQIEKRKDVYTIISIITSSLALLGILYAIAKAVIK